MKLRILAALVLFATMAVAARANYPNDYAAYYTFSVDSTDAYMQVNATVTGTTLPPVPPMSGAYHQAQVDAIWNGSHNWLYGQHVCTTCNVNLNESWDFPGDDQCWALGDCTLEMDSQVYCSFFGDAFWFASSGGGSMWFQKQYATTMWKNNSPPLQPPPWDLTPYCSARTTPPDLTVFGIVGNGDGTWQPALTASNNCERFGGIGLSSGWLCFAVISWTLPVLPTTKPDCTNWDNGYPGPIIKNTGGPQPMKPPKT
ncbi:MAG TPA: hypothetical protein VIX91_10910 [Candidatus Acidoferrum sp.]